MSKTSAMYEKKEQQTDDRTDLRSLSDQQLIEGYLEGNGKENRPAWNEFFRRFIPYINEGIREQLKSCRRLDLCYNQEVLLDIHEKIVVKLYSRGILRQCTNPSGIRSWLKTVAHNQTIDWLMEQGRKKRLPQRQVENSMVSLSTPLREGIDLTIEDTIATAAEISDELTTYVEKILDSITEIEDEKKLWVLRLSMISHLQLSREDVQELSRFGGHSVDNLISRLASIMQGVEAKEEKKNQGCGQGQKGIRTSILLGAFCDYGRLAMMKKAKIVVYTYYEASDDRSSKIRMSRERQNGCIKMDLGSKERRV